MIQISRLTKVFLLSASFLTAAHSYAQEQVQLSDLAEIKQRIAEAKSRESEYEGGLLQRIVRYRIEILEMTQDLLEQRAIVERGGTPVSVSVVGAEPDQERANQIFEDLQAQMKIVEAAEADASKVGGLVKAMALSRLETERLTLSQLKLAWFQAHYGIAGPKLPAADSSQRSEPSAPASTGKEDRVVAWADPRYPEIDYSKAPFPAFYGQGFNMMGWFGVLEQKSDIDDSPKVIAVNLSEMSEGRIRQSKQLFVQCVEGEAAVVYDTDRHLSTDYRSSTIPVVLRIDNNEPRNEDWSKLTSRKGVGLFGSRGIDLMRELADAERLVMRVVEDNGTKHDAVFDMRGISQVVELVAKACRFSPVALTPADYRTIQAMLNAAGYDVGVPDGVWGGASQSALRQFQMDTGGEVTGVPDKSTIEKLSSSD